MISGMIVVRVGQVVVLLMGSQVQVLDQILLVLIILVLSLQKEKAVVNPAAARTPSLLDKIRVSIIIKPLVVPNSPIN